MPAQRVINFHHCSWFFEKLDEAYENLPKGKALFITNSEDETLFIHKKAANAFMDYYPHWFATQN